jgi:hypothetical protein
MKTILKSAMFASVAAMGLSLAACDSGAENKMEADANATREAADEQSDAIEAQADAVDGPAEDAMEAKAEAVDDAGEAKADAMEDKADKMDGGAAG